MIKCLKQNGRKFMDALAFPLLLATFAHSTVGFDAKVEWWLAGLTGLMAVILLFEGIIQAAWWASLLAWVKEFNFNYLVFGLGLMAGGSAITDNPWAIIVFLFAGIGFVGVGLAHLNVEFGVKIAKINPRVAIVLGSLLTVFSIILTIIRWGSISKIEGTQMLVALGIGLNLVILGLVRPRRIMSNPQN
ncbi:MAG: hypothetical protein Q7J73_08100 [Dehalococcoidales bacterium]|nr:hypothetical protein [Dehalococcoidales bacterium]